MKRLGRSRQRYLACGPVSGVNAIGGHDCLDIDINERVFCGPKVRAHEQCCFNDLAGVRQQAGATWEGAASPFVLDPNLLTQTIDLLGGVIGVHGDDAAAKACLHHLLGQGCVIHVCGSQRVLSDSQVQ